MGAKIAQFFVRYMAGRESESVSCRVATPIVALTVSLWDQCGGSECMISARTTVSFPALSRDGRIQPSEH